jgi:uncharacterized membrane protein YgdD (TMEM256/DUF423 family)
MLQCALFFLERPCGRFAMSNTPFSPFVYHQTPRLAQPRLGSGSVSARWFMVLGALSAGTSVAFSAAFAHLPVFAAGVPSAVQSALNQQQFHSLGLLLTGLAIWVCGTSRWLSAAGGLMGMGLVLFSFNVYARYVLGFDALRVLVPWGGGAWILAWLCLAVGVAKVKAIANRIF